MSARLVFATSNAHKVSELEAILARGAERDALSDVGRVGDDVVVGGDDIVDVDEVFR